jgi:hypothetical protein
MQSLLPQAVKGMLPNNLLRNNFLRRQGEERRTGFEDPKSSPIHIVTCIQALLLPWCYSSVQHFVGFDQKHSRAEICTLNQELRHWGMPQVIVPVEKRQESQKGHMQDQKNSDAFFFLDF